MTNLSKKKINLFLLFIIAVAIWGINGYRLIKGIVTNDIPTLEIKAGISEFSGLINSDSLKNWKYPEGIRDPFILPVVKQPLSAKKTGIPKKPELLQPRIRLSGIIWDNDEKVALIEFPNSIVYFLKEGQKLDSLKVDKILETTVAIVYKNKKFEYSL